MKIRTDFVTNSSSSGFVVITVSLKNKKTRKLEEDYDTGYGGYFWNSGEDFEDAFINCKTGEDVIEAIVKNTNQREFIEGAFDWDQTGFVDWLKDIRSVSEIASIEMRERTDFEGGGSKDWSFRYSFNEKEEFDFVSHKDHKPSLNTKICLYGEFAKQTECDDYSSVVDEFTKRGWACFESFKNCFSYGPSHPRSDVKHNYAYLVIGDITAKEIRKGQIDPYIAAALKLQKIYDFKFITESEIRSIGDVGIPFDDSSKIDSVIDKTVLFCADSLYYDSVFPKILECGGLPIPGSEATDKNRMQYNVDYIVVSEKILGEKYNRHSDADVYMDLDAAERPPVFREKDFLERISQIRAGSSLPVKINCSGKSFFLTGMKPAIKNQLSEGIIRHGGVVQASAPNRNKPVDCVIYCGYPPALMKSIELKALGYDVAFYNADDVAFAEDNV